MAAGWVTLGDMTAEPVDRVPLDTLAARIYLARRRDNGRVIPQRRAAALVGVSHTLWQRWELGVAEPRYSQIRLIADKLGVNWRWLNEGGQLSSPDPQGSPETPPLPHLDSNQKPTVYRRPTRLLSSRDRRVKEPIGLMPAA